MKKMKKPLFLNSITNRYRHKLREKAIRKAKARIALSNRDISECTQEELEAIVFEEEEKLIEHIKTLSIGALLIFLGIA